MDDDPDDKKRAIGKLLGKSIVPGAVGRTRQGEKGETEGYGGERGGSLVNRGVG